MTIGRGVIFWSQPVVEAGRAGWHPRPGSVRVGVSLFLPGEKAGMISGRMRALGECVQQNREEGTTKWQHCIWCVEDTARVKRAWPWSCLHQIRPDLLGEDQCRRQYTRSKLCSQVLRTASELPLTGEEGEKSGGGGETPKKRKINLAGWITMRQNKLVSLKQESGKIFLLGYICLCSMCKPNKVWSLILQVTVNC